MFQAKQSSVERSVVFEAKKVALLLHARFSWNIQDPHTRVPFDQLSLRIVSDTKPELQTMPIAEAVKHVGEDAFVGVYPTDAWDQWKNDQIGLIPGLAQDVQTLKADVQMLKADVQKLNEKLDTVLLIVKDLQEESNRKKRKREEKEQNLPDAKRAATEELFPK